MFFVFLGAFIIRTRPFTFNDMALGSFLLVATLFVILHAIWVTVRDKEAEEELILRVREMEFRECEIDMDVASLRASIEQLLERYEPNRQQQHTDELLSADAGAASKKVHFIGLSSASSRDFSQPRRSLPLSVPLTTSTPKNEPSFSKGLYPCFCVSVTQLQSMHWLPEHEDALEQHRLEHLTPSTIMPCVRACANVCEHSD